MSALTYMALGALVYWALTRKRKEDPTCGGRIVPADPALHADAVAWHKQQHDTFSARHTLRFEEPRPFELWSVTAARYEAERKRAGREGLKMYERKP